MTDLDMLLLAAKAAGIEIAWSSEPGVSPRHKRTFTAWNPLTDDGDALRLAVKLHIDIQSYKESGNVHAYSKQLLGHGTDGVPSYQDGECMTQPLGEDPMGATRLAIVRAAAEIGRAMP